ncbi:DNA-binding transcriptional MerR regulator/transposase [Rhodoblastus sphagnicola]|uniref:transposase n=1 Tax=Rhodoblastus sphagnicola TaxID=333368 RepID=UPI001620B0E2|nr:DNA-binding transcriptional MerR regulator/transposase [Rhodoblastus sphagnicola]
MPIKLKTDKKGLPLKPNRIGESGTYRISNLAFDYKITRRTVRFYDRVLNPIRDGEHRYYDQSQYDRLGLILEARVLGLTLDDICKLFTARCEITLRDIVRLLSERQLLAQQDELACQRERMNAVFSEISEELRERSQFSPATRNGMDAGESAQDAWVRGDHPLRAICVIANDALEALAPELASLCSRVGKPEFLLRAMLLQVLYSVRSERQLMARLDTDLLFRWFVGMSVEDPVWDPVVFVKNRDLLLEEVIAAQFLHAVMAEARVKRLISSDYFSVDRALVKTWTSINSFRSQNGPNEERLPNSARVLEADQKSRKSLNRADKRLRQL